MVKHTQTIRRLLPTNCLSVFDHFWVGSWRIKSIIDAKIDGLRVLLGVKPNSFPGALSSAPHWRMKVIKKLNI